jgi:hypothetical protein
MTLNNRSGEPEPVVLSAGQQKKKRKVNMQLLAEKILLLLKKEARLERERQGPR